MLFSLKLLFQYVLFVIYRPMRFIADTVTKHFISIFWYETLSNRAIMLVCCQATLNINNINDYLVFNHLDDTYSLSGRSNWSSCTSLPPWSSLAFFSLWASNSLHTNRSLKITSAKCYYRQRGSPSSSNISSTVLQ